MGRTIFAGLLLLVLTQSAVQTSKSVEPARAVNSTAAGNGAEAITAGTSHTCALRRGGVWCWGENIYGQLGNGNTSNTPVSVPVPVSSLASGVSAISAGFGHTCAIKNGAVWCWGRNFFGQIGNNTTTDSLVPVQVGALANGVTAISAGGYHTCALKDGGLSCWGYNLHGQLGNNGTTDSALPVSVPGLASGVSAISAGGYQTCALKDGAASCWGWNDFGELGDSTTTSSSVPVSVIGLGSGVSAISAGVYYTCAIKHGNASCWGLNNYGQLGNSTTTDSSIPVSVAGLSTGATVISTAIYHTCAVADGAAQCWGRNSWGNLGNGTTTDSLVPVAVENLGSGTVAITTAREGFHSCAARMGAVSCWGLNGSGELGNNTTTNAFAPVAVIDLPATGAAAVNGESQHVCSLDGGSVSCWGRNDFGQLGNGSVGPENCLSGPDCSTTPLPALMNGIGAISTGEFHTCALKDGGAWCWGYNGYGELGNGSTVDSFQGVAVVGLENGVAAISAGTEYTCALKDGGVLCWGLNIVGQLGSGTTIGPELCQEAPVPCSKTAIPVSGMSSGVSQISVGWEHACAIRDGGVWCWARNANGQLGNNSTEQSSVPVPVVGLESGVSAVSAGHSHSCAIKNGGVWCWGSNVWGQLGNGSVTQTTVPVAVPGLTSGVGEISAGYSNTCAVRDGGAWCWGSNTWGQLGIGANSGPENCPAVGSSCSKVPVAVLGMTGGINGVTAGYTTQCALQDGATWCWGFNQIGALGNCTTVSSPVPVRVVFGDQDEDGYRDCAPPFHPGPDNTNAGYDDCPFLPNQGQANNDGNFSDQSPPFLASVDDLTWPNSDAAGDACDADDDNDRISDADEASGAACAAFGPTNPLLRDTDADRFLDGAECALGTDPTSFASKPLVTACGATTDMDSDKLTERVEYCFYGTDPNNADTDGDKTLDGAKDGCEAASFNGDRIVNVADMGMLATAISNVAFRVVSVDVNKDGVWNPADQGLVASFISPSGQCPG